MCALECVPWSVFSNAEFYSQKCPVIDLSRANICSSWGIGPHITLRAGKLLRLKFKT